MGGGSNPVARVSLGCKSEAVWRGGNRKDGGGSSRCAEAGGGSRGVSRGETWGKVVVDEGENKEC